MEYGWGFAALMAGLLLTGLVFVVTGIQMACGRWRHALAGAAGLSEREREILVAVARGLTNREIADQYFISIHTVISHRKNITRKTGIKTIAGLTVYALLNNMISEADLGN